MAGKRLILTVNRHGAAHLADMPIGATGFVLHGHCSSGSRVPKDMMRHKTRALLNLARRREVERAGVGCNGMHRTVPIKDGRLDETGSKVISKCQIRIGQ